VAPTILQMLGLEQPLSMTASSLLLKPLNRPAEQATLRGAA